MEVSINGGNQKWMVYNGKSVKIPLKCMIWGYPPISGNLHKYKQNVISERVIVEAPCLQCFEQLNKTIFGELCDLTPPFGFV